MWYRIREPGDRLRLEYMTYVMQEVISPATGAQTLGRFRNSNALVELGKVLESDENMGIQYGADRHLYIGSSYDPMSYFEKLGLKHTLTAVKAKKRPPVLAELHLAHDNIAFSDPVGHISGLLRVPLLDEAFSLLKEKKGTKPFALIMNRIHYMRFVAETEFDPTNRYPLLANNIMGMYEGATVHVRGLFPHDIEVVGEDGSTVLLNCD